MRKMLKSGRNGVAEQDNKQSATDEEPKTKMPEEDAVGRIDPTERRGEHSTDEI